jgi:hypothetical protein
MTIHPVTGAYAGRDMLNAPAVKAEVLRRSQARHDSPDVQAWLLNHFYRHVIANFSPAQPALVEVTSIDQARTLFLPKPVPSWVAKRLREASAWWIEPTSTELLALEVKLLEFLQSRTGTALEGKLQRVNCPQALALWAAEHAAFEAREVMGWREHTPAAVRTVWQSAQGEFVELLANTDHLRAEMAFESQIMRHCLGQFADKRALQGGYGEHYASACEDGSMRLFSYRTGNQQAHITINAQVLPDGKLDIDQIKGKHNRPPIARYAPEVLQFLNSLNTTETTSSDALGMGMVRLPKRWALVSDITDAQDQLFIAHRYPHLFAQLQHPDLLAQWIAAARDPKALKGLALHPQVSHAVRAVWQNTP